VNSAPLGTDRQTNVEALAYGCQNRGLGGDPSVLVCVPNRTNCALLVRSAHSNKRGPRATPSIPSVVFWDCHGFWPQAGDWVKASRALIPSVENQVDTSDEVHVFLSAVGLGPQATG
jgi:hypothetical protein